jgi:type II secretory pathway component PulF
MNTLPSFRFTYRHQKKQSQIYSSYHICALAMLLRQDISVNNISLSAFYINWKKLFQRNPSHLTLTQFLKQLLSLLTANIPILDAIFLLKQTHPKKNIRQIAAMLFIDLERGIALSQALHKNCPSLGMSAISLLSLAENTGTLIPALGQLIKQREQIDKLTRQVRQSLRYPIILLILSLLIINLLLVVVIPQFSSLYQQMGNEIPASTQILLAISSGLQRYGIIIFFISIIFIAGFRYLLHHNPIVKKSLHYFLYYCPGINHLIKQSVCSRVLHCLAIALNAQSPILTALSYAKEAADNIVYEKSFDFIIQQMQQGASLYDAFSKARCFNDEILHLIRIGEESGQLAEMFTELALLTQQRMENTFGQISQYAEPAMMLVVGGVIAFILMSLYGPILLLGQQVG